MPQPINPYIAGRTVEDQAFFDRQDILELVERELRNRHNNSIVLFGQRRIGKTSLLLKLRAALPAGEFLPVFFDLQDKIRMPLEQMLGDLAKEMSARAGLTLQASDERLSEQAFRDDFLPRFLEKAGTARPVLLLDEFDQIDHASEAGPLAAGDGAASFLRFLRGLMGSFPQLGFVFAAGRNPTDQLPELQVTFKASQAREVWVLKGEHARQLVRQAQDNGTLEFADTAVERVLDLTSGHPYLTQLLCQRIWEWAYQNRPKAVPQIHAADVEETVGDALSAGNAALEWIWRGLSISERIYASALAEASEEKQPISKDKVTELLNVAGSRLRDRRTELAPGELVQRHMLEEVGERQYVFAVELLRRWVRMNHPLRKTKDELDNEIPTAVRFLTMGKEFFNEKDWDSAIECFKKAIAANPRHLEARLALGETLLQLEQLPAAIRVFEEAWDLDREEARLPLARAWVMHAKNLWSQKDFNGALQASNRALELSPTEQAAQEIKTQIWTRRGDEAAQEQDWAAAITAYEHAANSERVAEIRNSKDKEEKLAGRFTQGLGALEQGDSKTATEALLWVVTQRPDYERNGQKAVRLLVEAVEDGKQPVLPFIAFLRRPRIWLSVLAIMVLAGIGVWSFAASLEGTVEAAGRQGRGPMAWMASPTSTRTLTPTMTGTATLPPTQTALPIGTPTPVTLSAGSVAGLTPIRLPVVGRQGFNAVYALAFSADGNMLASGLQNGETNLWSLSGGQNTVLTSSNSPVFALAFAPHTNLLVSAAGSEITWWDLRGVPAQSYVRSVGSRVVHALDFSPPGDVLIAGAGPDVVWWNAQTATKGFDQGGQLAAVDALAFSRDGTTLASGAADRTIALWNVNTGQHIGSLYGHHGGVRALAFSPLDESLLASASEDHSVILWNTATASPVRVLQGIHLGTVHCVAFSRDGTLLASGSADGVIALWDVTTGQALKTFTEARPVLSLAFSPDGSLLATGDDRGQITLWGLPENLLRYTFVLATPGP